MSLPASPIPSSFDEFERQQRSFDKIDAHRQELADEAARVAIEQPGARLVGLIFEHDAAVAPAIRRTFGIPEDGPRVDFVGIVPRHLALRFAGQDGTEGLEAMRDDARGALRWLPILFFAGTGLRWGRAEYRVDAPPG